MGAAEVVALGLVAGGSGVLGTMLGLGGGVFLVPILTLLFDVPLRAAIAASAVSVVANSVSGSRVYLQLRYTNVRLAFTLLLTTAFGALVGGLLAVSIPEAVLKGIFGTLLIVIAGIMIKRRQMTGRPETVEIELPSDPYQLAGRYWDGPTGDLIRYVPERLRTALSVSSVGGVASGMFGIGGGPITVPVMNVVMGVPMKAAASTSSFMVGLTASTSAFVYYNAGYVNPTVTVPTVFGIIIGARIGARTASLLRPAILHRLFIAVMIVLAILMYLDAVGVL